MNGIAYLIAAIIEWYRNRKIRNNLTVADYREINRLLIKAGRRCAYDLKHAAGDLGMCQMKFERLGVSPPHPDQHRFFSERAYHWQSIFNPADDGKSYRDQLHMTIWSLESQVEKYEKLLEEKGIHDPILSDKIPF
jgi:hypothetical protein